jgi:uncharacterized protein YbcC (UPF0753/DUF2309 family)
MNAVTSAEQVSPARAAKGPVDIEAAIEAACRRIAPLWPLKHFVAVNPFLGFAGQRFEETCATLRRVAQVDMLMPRAFYIDALARAAIEGRDLEAALRNAPAGRGLPQTVDALRAVLADERAAPTKHPAVVATVAEVLDRLAAGDRQASRTAFMIDEISKWCAAYFDEGQSVWRLPARGMSFYAGWRASARNDLNPEIMGVKGFRGEVARMPEDPLAAISVVVDELGIPARAVEDYLYRALFDIRGWASYARYLVWNAELDGRSDDTLVQLLAVRLVWGLALFSQRKDSAFVEAWRGAMADAASAPTDTELGSDTELSIDLILQAAYEHAYQRQLLEKLSASPTPPAGKPVARKAVQAAFCIDVRSEIYRRAFEAVCPDAETIGFAGFFGFPIEYVPIGNVRGGAQCPVLLKPKFVVSEALGDLSAEAEEKTLALRRLRRRAKKAWKSFKLSAISSFTYVETTGLMFAPKLASDSFGITRPVSDPNVEGIDKELVQHLGPRITAGMSGGRRTGFDDGERIQMAEAVLRGMSLTDGFARVVLLIGHGSTTVNNPHGSGLDCGACGGHTGEANARVAAAILNDSQVRSGLLGRGIRIPEDTLFVGCLHDTTTDAVALFDLQDLPPTHKEDVARVKSWLVKSSSLARAERAALLGVPSGKTSEARIFARSRDWSQVRPEWGLAGNAAFIAAPRERTSGINLDGRAFLHSYYWQLDKEFSVLELIMTAPMVVASWINLQYYGSTVNNRVFGAGNKVLHNVSGTIGVLEGNSGDLRVGLPWQSVHDGNRFVHEPLRLNVVIDAPLDAINGIIARQQSVRDLVDNCWIHLFAFGDQGRIYRYRGELAWESAP